MRQPGKRQGLTLCFQQNARWRTAGVLWLGSGALRGVLADVPDCRCALPQAAKFVVYRACPAHATRSTPLRGIPPQRALDCVGAGSMSCCARRPDCAASAVAAGRSLDWSSDDTHPMPAMFAPDLEVKDATAPRLSLTRCPCQSGGATRMLSKRTALRPDPVFFTKQKSPPRRGFSEQLGPEPPPTFPT